jgi:hypothetical protein
MDVFEMLASMRREKTTKVMTKRVKINIIPRFIVPSVVSLDIVAVVVAINVESDALVVLTGDRYAIYVTGYLLVITMVNRGAVSETSMLTISSGKKVRIDVETRSQRKFVICHDVVLMCPNPDGCEWASQLPSA